MGSEISPGGKENDKERQAVFFTPVNPFGNAPEEEELHFDHTVPQQVHDQTCWKRNQDAVKRVKLSRAQDQGLRFWQTKSFAFVTNATVPGDCIDRVTSQNGDRVVFERLATPRPAPMVGRTTCWILANMLEVWGGVVGRPQIRSMGVATE